MEVCCMKKLLLLGGSRFLLPVIKAAKKLGYHTITCDYLPNNIAHKYSDEYSNVSIRTKKLYWKPHENCVLMASCHLPVIPAW